MTTSSPIKALRCWSAVAAALLAASARLEAEPAKPLWELGFVGLGLAQQAYPGSDERVRRSFVLPYLLYRGEVLRADEETIGIRAIKDRVFELDIGLGANLGSRAGQLTARRGMPDLGTTVEFGPRAKWFLSDRRADGVWRFEVPARWVVDVSDRFRERGAVVEPTLVYACDAPDQTSFSVSAGALLGDRRMARTWYGVDARYVAEGRPAYDARAGLIAWRLGAAASKPVAANWHAFGFLRVDSVAGAVNRRSPLVRQTVGASIGVGLAWTWMRSDQRIAY